VRVEALSAKKFHAYLVTDRAAPCLGGESFSQVVLPLRHGGHGVIGVDLGSFLAYLLVNKVGSTLIVVETNPDLLEVGFSFDLFQVLCGQFFRCLEVFGRQAPLRRSGLVRHLVSS
jgi:hypothetical protein